MNCAACKHIQTLTRAPCAYCGRLNVEAESARTVATAAQFRAHGDSCRIEGFRAGLRRAQELAKEHAHVKWHVVHGEVIEWEQSDRAIDAEAAKERE